MIGPWGARVGSICILAATKQALHIYLKPWGVVGAQAPPVPGTSPQWVSMSVYVHTVSASK